MCCLGLPDGESPVPVSLLMRQSSQKTPADAPVGGGTSQKKQNKGFFVCFMTNLSLLLVADSCRVLSD